MWGVPFGVGVSLFGADLVHLVIGDRWRAAILLLQVYGITAAINHVGFNWTAYFRARWTGRGRSPWSPVAAAVVLLGVGIPLMILLGLRGFAIGVAAQALAALVLRAVYLGRLFAGFSFLRHAARAFVPTVPAAAVVLAARWLDPGRPQPGPGPGRAGRLRADHGRGHLAQRARAAARGHWARLLGRPLVAGGA